MKNRLLTLQKLVPTAVYPSRENGNGVAFIKRPGDEVGNPDNTNLHSPATTETGATQTM